MANLLCRSFISSHVILPFPGISCMSVRWRKHVQKPLKKWQQRQKHIGAPLINKIPDEHKKYEPTFEEVTTFEHQLNSLKFAGFHRPYTPYSPPADMESRFFKVCKETIPGGLPNDTDLSQIKLGTDLSLKSKLLSALARELEGHSIPNSMLHTMNTLDKVFHFYSLQVDMKTPYERLEAATRSGDLPANLHIMLDAYRFDPVNGTSDLDKVTAFPRSSTILVTPEARRKYKEVVAKHPPWLYCPPK